jgi:DNA repair photolyase
VTHGTRGYRATGIATVNPEYPDYMKMALAKLNVASAAYISSFTEPFQHLEAKHHVTQRLSEVLVEAGLPLYYLTRLIPPDWAVDAMLANPYSYMQWSINTSNETHRRRMSPGTSRIEVILDKIGELRKRGIFVSIQCNPVLPGITSLQELVDLVHMVAEAGANHIIFKFAEQVYSNRALLMERLTQHRLPGVEKFDAMMNQTLGGVYTIEQAVRIEWLEVLLKESRDAGITMSTCYEYYDDGHAGANYAPYVTTSDQCHGKGVPVFYRPEPGAQFLPLPGCYRKGCLYCEDHGTQACGNETLLQAKALEYKDLRETRIEGHFPDDWAIVGSCLSPEEVRDGPWWNPDMKTDAELWGWDDPFSDVK